MKRIISSALVAMLLVGLVLSLAACSSLSGTYTDPPALAYSNSICSREAPALGYSTVYPLSMFLRILTAQLIVLFFCG